MPDGGEFSVVQDALDAVRAAEEAQALMEDPRRLVEWAFDYGPDFAAAVIEGMQLEQFQSLGQDFLAKLAVHPAREVRVAVLRALGRLGEADSDRESAGL